MPESEPIAVYRAPRNQLIAGLSFALPLTLVCAAMFVAVVATGDYSAAPFFFMFGAFGVFTTYHQGWRIVRDLEVTATTLRWRAAFSRGEVAVERIRGINRISQRGNASWRLTVADGQPLLVAHSPLLRPFLNQVVRAANAARRAPSGAAVEEV